MLLYHTYLSLKDKLRKAQHEREQLECQLKTEKDEKELYKVIYLLHIYCLLLQKKWRQSLGAVGQQLRSSLAEWFWLWSLV